MAVGCTSGPKDVSGRSIQEIADAYPDEMPKGTEVYVRATLRTEGPEFLESWDFRTLGGSGAVVVLEPAKGMDGPGTIQLSFSEQDVKELLSAIAEAATSHAPAELEMGKGWRSVADGREYLIVSVAVIEAKPDRWKYSAKWTGKSVAPFGNRTSALLDLLAAAASSGKLLNGQEEISFLSGISAVPYDFTASDAVVKRAMQIKSEAATEVLQWWADTSPPGSDTILLRRVKRELALRREHRAQDQSTVP